MTCPECRKQGKKVEVDFKKVEEVARSVEAKVTVFCPECKWEGTFNF